MRKFIKNILLFILPIALLATTIEVIARKVPNPYSSKYEWMQKNAETVETLVLGSSHSFFGIRPNLLGMKSYSLANVSQQLDQDAALLEQWGNRYHSLKTVVATISLFSLFSQGLENGSESWRCRYYNIYMDCNLWPTDLSTYFEVANPSMAKEKIIKAISGNKESGCDDFGWGTDYKLNNKDTTSWNNNEEAKAAIKRHTAKNWDYVEYNTAKLRRLIVYCKSHGIRLVLVTTPCWHSYYDRLPKEQTEKMYSIISQMTKEYNISYLDYMKDTRFNADDFYDSNHLSDVGATKFSKILKADIDNL